MPKYRKKPVVVEAHQWFKNGDHPEGDAETKIPGLGIFPREGKIIRYYRTPDIDSDRQCEKCGVVMHEHGWIDTLEGGHIVCPGDWIITGVQGDRYPCKPDIFESTYEKVLK